MSTSITMDMLKHQEEVREDPSTLSSRLRHALQTLRVSQSELARRIGVKPQIIQYLCTGNVHKSKFTYNIAIALEINPDWLFSGRGSISSSSYDLERIKQVKVPLLRWDQIIDWLDKDGDIDLAKTEFIYTLSRVATSSYALPVTDTSMIPRFELNAILIVDPTLTAKEGDFVIVKTSCQEQPIVRQMLKQEDTMHLVPTNKSLYKERILTSQDKVLGVVSQACYEFVRYEN